MATESLAFEDQGGFCDPSPGRDVFNVAVSDERIRALGPTISRLGGQQDIRIDVNIYTHGISYVIIYSMIYIYSFIYVCV